jgi:hypothetical protein
MIATKSYLCRKRPHVTTQEPDDKYFGCERIARSDPASSGNQSMLPRKSSEYDNRDSSMGLDPYIQSVFLSRLSKKNQMFVPLTLSTPGPRLFEPEPDTLLYTGWQTDPYVESWEISYQEYGG